MKRTILLFSSLFLLASCAVRPVSPSSPISPEDFSSSSKKEEQSSSESDKGHDSVSSSSSSISEDPNFPSFNQKTKIAKNMADYMENNVYALSATPSIGKAKLLVIPIWFTNSSKYIASDKKEQVRSDIETAYFGTEEETGWNSVKSYYETLSHGRLVLEGTVASWYECGKSSSSYYSEESGADYTMTLVQKASDAYFASNPRESRKDYDLDGDGYLDGVMLIYGAPDYASLNNNNASNLWAYTFWIQDGDKQNVASPGANVFFWASYDFMYSEGNEAKKRVGSTYGGGDTSHCTLDAHTYIHEMGHAFGLDDYYDYSQQYNPAGGFSMQDMNVGSHDPYSSLTLGWTDPYIPTEDCKISLRPFTETGDAVLLSTNPGSVDSAFGEYLLLEFYTPTGLNQLDSTYSYSECPTGPTSSGIRVWHVDTRLAYLTYTQMQDQSVDFMASQIASDPTLENCGVTLAFSNTYYASGTEDYVSVLGKKYADYNQLQLIRNDETATHQCELPISDADLFRDRESFSMSTFGNQFIKKGKMNNGESLGWSFSVHIQGSGTSAIAELKIQKA